MTGTELVFSVVLAFVCLFLLKRLFKWICYRSAVQELDMQKSFYDQAKVRRSPQQKETKAEKKVLFIPNSKLKKAEARKR